MHTYLLIFPYLLYMQSYCTVAGKIAIYAACLRVLRTERTTQPQFGRDSHMHAPPRTRVSNLSPKVACDRVQWNARTQLPRTEKCWYVSKTGRTWLTVEPHLPKAGSPGNGIAHRRRQATLDNPGLGGRPRGASSNEPYFVLYVEPKSCREKKTRLLQDRQRSNNAACPTNMTSLYPGVGPIIASRSSLSPDLSCRWLAG